MNAHVVFNGQSRRLKFFTDDATVPQPRHDWECHDVGIADGEPGDPYGHNHKCPPGEYTLGSPIPSQTPPDPVQDAPYGFWFTALWDTPESQAMARHGRAGIGIHGGGSDLPDPFAARQGWEWTHGCLRLQNEDNEAFTQSLRYILGHGGDARLTVYWP